MKKIITSLLVAGLGTSLVNAQIFTVDPSIQTDNAAYEAISFTPNFTSPEWEDASTSALVDSTYLQEGYMYDVIFLGEGAGFNYSDLYFIGNMDAGGTPNAGTETLSIFNDITSPPLTKGDYVTVTVHDNADAVADQYLFDFLLDSTDNVGNPYGFTYLGEFNLFYPVNDVGDMGTVAANGIYNTENIASNYLVFAFEDLGTPDSDEDFNDMVFAINLNGTQVPEPSTYGIIGALALLGLMLSRRLRNAKSE